jgi:phospholipase/carboxylesterase
MVKILSGPIRKSLSGKTNELVIFFHGYGADGNDLISLSDSFAKLLPNAEFYSPNAPNRCEMGVGYQWFPIRQNADGTINLNSSKEIIFSVNMINDYINLLIKEKKTDISKILLIGFSQGTMIALETMISKGERFMGLIGFSGGFLDVTKKNERDSIKTPILLIHGDVDQVVPMNMTNIALEQLYKKGFQVEKHICKDLGHGISIDGLNYASEFLRKILSNGKN